MSLRRTLLGAVPLLAIAWSAACGGDGGTEPEPPAQPNRPPVASGSIPAQTLTVGESTTVNAASLFSDPDGDALTYAATSANAGVAAVALSGSTVTITAVSAGTATVTVTARDSGGLSASLNANVTVEEPNRPPAALIPVAPPQTAAPGDTIRVDVSPFFSDPDGDALVYSAASSNTAVVTVAMTGSTATAVAEGVGSATLTVTATDPEGLSAAVSVPVAVLQPNRAPLATVTMLPSRVLDVGDTLTQSASSLFVDPDGDELTYSASSSDAEVVRASMTGSTVTITAVSDGTAVVTVTASDPEGLSASLTGDVTVRESNHPPVALVPVAPPQTVTLGDTVVLDVSPFFSDPDGDALTYSAESSNAAVVTVSMTDSLATAVASGVGSATVTVTASDPEGLSASVSVPVMVRHPNRAPMATVSTIPRQTIELGDTVTLNVSSFFTDPDGDPLAFSATTSDAEVATVTVTGATVAITGTGIGTAMLRVTASDPGDLSTSLSAQATVIGAGHAYFRDDFDDETSLSSWHIQAADAVVSEGILRLTGTHAEYAGALERELDSPMTSWEIRVRMGVAESKDEHLASAFWATGGSRYLAMRFDIGNAITVDRRTNYRVAIYDLKHPDGMGWYALTGSYGVSDAIKVGEGELNEITIRLQNGILDATAGGEALFREPLSVVFSREITAIALWTHALEDQIGATALFDWVEVKGVPAGSSANGDEEDSRSPAALSDFITYSPQLHETPVQFCRPRGCR